MNLLKFLINLFNLSGFQSEQVHFEELILKKLFIPIIFSLKIITKNFPFFLIV